MPYEFDRNRRGAPLVLSTLVVLAFGGAALALPPVTGLTYEIDRQNINNGSVVRSSASFVTRPAIIGQNFVGHSTGANFKANHGGVGGVPVINADDVWVDRTWLAQTDVEGDPTIGLAGCNPPAGLVVLGANAFASIGNGLAAVNPGGRVHVMNGVYSEEALLVNKDIEVFGEDESVAAAPGCSAFDGRNGVMVRPFTLIAPGKTIFEVASADVTLRDMSISGDMLASPPAVDAEYGIHVDDATAAFDNLTVDNVGVSEMAQWGVYLLAPDTSGHQVVDSDFANMGDMAAGGGADGGGVFIGGAGTTVDSVSVIGATNGVVAVGDGDPLVTIPAIPSVTVANSDFTNIGTGASNGRGAVAFENNVIGDINLNTITNASTGIRAFHNVVDGGVVQVAQNDLSGGLDIGVDAYEVYSPPASVAPSSVVITNNDFAGAFTQSVINARYVGMDDGVASQNDGSVNVTLNTLTNTFGPGTPSMGVFVHGVDPGSGSVLVQSNAIDGVPLGSDAGIQLHTHDLVAGTTNDAPVDNVDIHGNNITNWNGGIEVESADILGGPGAVSEAVIGTLASNTVTDNVRGILLGGQASSATITGNADINSNVEGLTVGAGTAVAFNNGFDDNDTAIRVANNGDITAQGNTIITGNAGGSTGIEVASASNADFGGLVSTGGNSISVLDSSGWAMRVQGSAAAVAAENNTWSYQGLTYSGSVAVDDLIQDGDLDNLAVAGEGGTVGPVDFLPFAGAVPTTPVALDDSSVRGVTAFYGVSAYRSLSDAVEGTTSGGTVDVANGDYFSQRYNANGVYNVPGMPLPNPISIIAPAIVTATVYPIIDGPGTNSPTVLEAGSTTLFQVESDSIGMRGLILDGDNPAVAGATTVNGVNINARNGIAIVASATADGPDVLTFDQLHIRNMFSAGITTDPGAGLVSTDVQVLNSEFDNIAGNNFPGVVAAAIQLENVATTLIQANLIDRVRNGIVMRVNDATSLHQLISNGITNFSDTGIELGGLDLLAAAIVRQNFTLPNQPAQHHFVHTINTGAVATLDNNTIEGGNNGVVVFSVDGASAVNLTNNDFIAPGLFGILTADISSSGPGTGLLVDGNDIQGAIGGAFLTTNIAPLGTVPNEGTVFVNNSFANNSTGIELDGSNGVPASMIVGGALATDANTFDTNNTGIRIGGASAVADVTNHSTGPEIFDGGITAIEVRNGAAARIVNNRFENWGFAAVRVTNNAEALIDSNYALASLGNNVGVLVEGNSRASMGPGAPANALTNPYFGGLESTGFNRLRDYTGLAGNFAIHNLSILDQNAENNDFGIEACAAPDPLGPPYIEDFVEHQPDNAQGLVDFCPPLAPFTTIEDWKTLNRG